MTDNPQSAIRDPQSPNVLPFPQPTAPPLQHSTTPPSSWHDFVQIESLALVEGLRSVNNRLAHCVEVHRTNFPGEPFPKHALEKIGDESVRLALIFSHAQEAAEAQTPH
jgi:hypothetical protein